MTPLVVLLGALGFTLAGTPLARRFAWQIGLTVDPSPVRFHASPTPLLGGIAIYGAVVLALLLFGDPVVAPQLGGILTGATLVALLGMLDDRRPISPTIKLLVEAAAALVLFAAGVRVGFVGGPVIWAGAGLYDLLLTVLWVVAVTNAANLMDNMDGVLGGVAAVAAGSFMLMAVDSGQELVAPLSAALMGASLGFLVYNFNPASIFMGDSGSLFLGFVLAALGIKLRFPEHPAQVTWMVPVLVMAVPLFDTILVILSRIRRGVNPLTTGGQDHFSHRLVAGGATPREAAMAIWLLCCAAGGMAILASRTGGETAWLTLALAILIGIWGLWHLELRRDAVRMIERTER